MTVYSMFVRGLMDGVQQGNVLWFNLTSPTPEKLENVLEGIATAYTTNISPRQSDQFSWIDILVRAFDGGGAFSTPYSPTTFPEAGALTGERVAPQNALLISTSTGTARPNRGRVYIPGLTEVDWDGDSWSSTLTAAGEGLADDLMAITDGQWVVARPNYIANTVTLFNPVSDRVVRGYAGSQRGRRF